MTLPLQHRLSPEFQLLAACSVWPPSDDRCGAIRQVAREVAWGRVLAEARRHRVQGLLHAGLVRAGVELPSEIRAALEKAAATLARRNLAYAAEALRLQALFRAAGISVLFVKGASLAQLAYGTLAIRHAKDIDLLVAPERLEAGLDLMERAGYRRIVPPADLPPALFRHYLRHGKECEFVHRQSGLQVEVHWRLADNRTLLTDLTSDAPPRVVPLGNQGGLATLGAEDLFAYLCLHGASHGWSRLKWLADIGTWLAGEDEIDIMRLYRAAELRRVGHAAAQALLLCRRLFGTPLPSTLEATFRASRRVRWLEAIALRQMAGGGAAELTDRAFGTTGVFLSALLLGQGWRYWRAELHVRFMHLDDLRALPLPSGFHGLYPALRVPLWLWRRLRHGGRSAPPRPHAAPDRPQP